MQMTLVCIGLKEEGNLGAVARAMKNFAVSDLLLIDCPANHLSKISLDRASHAKEILQNAKKADGAGCLKCLKDFDYVIGTTAKLGTFYNLPRVPLTPKQLGEKLSELSSSLSNSNIRVAVVLGREDRGLSNDEIALCDFVVSIPASKDYPILNVSHACGIILYEIFQAVDEKKNKSHISILYASKKEKETALSLANEIISSLKFSTAEKKETQKRLWKKLIGKSFMTKKEATSLMGFFKKILKRR